jgi:hypothetical protein
MTDPFTAGWLAGRDADQRLVALFAGKAGRLRWKELVA